MNQVCNAVKQIEAWLTARRQGVNHRDWLWIQGDLEWANAIAEHILKVDTHATEDAVWIGERHSDCPSLNAQQSKSLLGTECTHGVYNSFSQFDLNALYRLTGTIKSGGLLILLSPPMADWPHHCQCLPFQSYGFVNSSSDFIRYLTDRLCAEPAVVQLTPDGIKASESWHTKSTENIETRQNDHDKEFKPSEEQQNIVEDILKNTAAHSKFSAVLTAKRGRGKSWLLGWVIKHFLRSEKLVALVAPQAKSTNQIFRHIDSESDKLTFTYCAPDDPKLFSATFDLVVVDEAASIPMDILKRINEYQSSCIFSTTTGGYEGSASGFQHRFIPYLEDSQLNYVKRYSLIAPMRWLVEDRVESIMDSLMVEELALNAVKLETKPNEQSVNFVTLSSQQLIDNPELAQQVISLLSDAHYQTTPNDFVRLFDAKDSQTFLLTENEYIVGAAVCLNEGNFKSEDLILKICSGERRVKGHMTPQYLSFQTTKPEFSKFSYLRINRIAIDVRFQSSGLGSHFLRCIRDYAKLDNIQFLSSFFGSTQQLLRFWENNAFDQFRIGEKTDKASGNKSALYLQPLAASAGEFLSSHREVSAQQQLQKLLFFAKGQRNLASVRSALEVIISLDTTKEEQAPSKLLLHVSKNPLESENSIVDKFLLTGKKELSNLIREELLDYLQKKTPL